MKLPDFVVIGAAKAGTTALYWHLKDHPQIYMSPMKETNFFAYGTDKDGRLLYGDPELHRFPIRTLKAYAALFDGAGAADVAGEASPIYLECPQAAGRMANVIPSVRIVCGLRDPVDRAFSDYLMYLRNRGRRLDEHRDLLPSARWAQPESHWMRLGHYHDQLLRYYNVFPRAAIHIFLFDDFRASPGAAVSGVYRHLDVDDTFQPNLETPHNVGGVPARMWVERMLTSDVIRKIAEPLLSRGVADWVRGLRMKNMQKAPTLPSELRAQLAEHFHADLEKTSELIDRDLTGWM